MVAKKDTVERPKSRMGQLFSTGRQIIIFCYFILFLCVDISLLGLVSEQLHRFGNVWTRYPSGMWYHAMGLLLFASIFYLLVGLTHWWFGHFPLMFLLFAGGVFFGTGAGIFVATPFGHGLQCGNPAESFSEKYRPFVDQCSRITAITGLSWAMFGLCTLGFFYLAQDKLTCASKRSHIYEPYTAAEEGQQHSPIKH